LEVLQTTFAVPKLRHVTYQLNLLPKCRATGSRTTKYFPKKNSTCGVPKRKPTRRMLSKQPQMQMEDALQNFYSSLETGAAPQNKESQQPVEDDSDDKHTFRERKIIKNYQKKSLAQRQAAPPQLCKICGR
jgi:hypothetical protein